MHKISSLLIGWMRGHWRETFTLFAVCGSSAAQVPPPARPLGATIAASLDPFGTAATIRALSGGRVLVNDPTARRLVLLDSTLTTLAVILDSASGASQPYGRSPGGLIPYRADSSLFVDPANLSMLLIDPSGQISRTLAVPRPREVMGLLGGTNGSPGFDTRGWLVYRGTARATRVGSGAAVADAARTDSAPLVRLDLQSRALDTAGWVSTPHQSWITREATPGQPVMHPVINPLPLVDAWAVLSDGTIAIVRGVDYHIDWVTTDGFKRSSGRLPFSWQRLSDDDKARFLDSTKAALERLRVDATARDPVRGPLAPYEFLSAGGVPATVIWRPGTPMSALAVPLDFVAPSELPDYPPPFAPGAARGDADGNLWVRTSLGVSGGAIYDIINRRGELFDRVYVPPGHVIVGFGAGGVVFMAVREGSQTRLERARVR